MIFVIVGSQKFQFNRLIIEVDRLKQEGILQDRVVAQIGACDYEPKHIEGKRFMDKEDFDAHIAACDLLITHAGEGSIMTGLLRQRKVIAVPRYERFGEHVSDHQLEIARALERQGCIVNVEDIHQLEGAIKDIDQRELVPYVSGNDNMIQSICSFIEGQQ